jgi:hypothetical protein
LAFDIEKIVNIPPINKPIIPINITTSPTYP